MVRCIEDRNLYFSNIHINVLYGICHHVSIFNLIIAFSVSTNNEGINSSEIYGYMKNILCSSDFTCLPILLYSSQVLLLYSWNLILWYFLFHGLHFATTLRVLKPVLCFDMTSFNYGAKGVRDVDPTCRCHQSNIMPDGIFSVNIAQCVTCS